jgi:hypothetical protein
MFSMCFRAGFFGVDEFRYGIEQMHPAVYLLSPYYEHWIHTVEHYGEAKGVLDLDELDRRTQYYLEHPDAPLPQREDPGRSHSPRPLHAVPDRVDPAVGAQRAGIRRTSPGAITSSGSLPWRPSWPAAGSCRNPCWTSGPNRCWPPRGTPTTSTPTPSLSR